MLAMIEVRELEWDERRMVPSSLTVCAGFRASELRRANTGELATEF